MLRMGKRVFLFIAEHTYPGHAVDHLSLLGVGHYFSARHKLPEPDDVLPGLGHGRRLFCAVARDGQVG